MNGELELNILEILADNCKITPEKIADMLDLSVEEVKEEIEKLEDENVIVKYCSLIDWDKVDLDTVTANIEVKVTPERGFGFDAVAKRLYKFPEVTSLTLISGDYDFSVTVQGGNIKEVSQFVSEKLSTIDQIQSTSTHFVLKRYKKDGVILKQDPEAEERLVVSP